MDATHAPILIAPIKILMRFANKKILVLANVDWFLVSHRLPILEALVAEGASLVIACGRTRHFDELVCLKNSSQRELSIDRSGRNLVTELRVLRQIQKTIRDEKPDLVYNISQKPILYGTFVTRLFQRKTPVVNAVSGFGYGFSSGKFLFWMFKVAYRLILNTPRCTMILQNPGALAWFREKRLASRAHTVLIEGAGVDCEEFRPRECHRLRDEPARVALAGRMLRDKGVLEFVEAAKLVAKRFPNVEFILVGPLDLDGNPTALSAGELSDLLTGSPVTWVGPRSDMALTLQSIDILVLPSYHEGLPKILIEGAACGLALIASDIDGCRSVVAHEVTGLLVKARDAAALADALCLLLVDQDLCLTLGRRARREAVMRFDVNLIAEQVLLCMLDALSARDR